jgi:hypothetical protein
MYLKTLTLNCFNYPIDSEFLSKNAELAVLIGFSEINRKRTSFLSKTLENIQYISPFYYPILGYPWRSRMLLIHQAVEKQKELNYNPLPNIHNILGDVQRYSFDREQYISFLKNGKDLFSYDSKTKKIDVSSIISNHNLGKMIINKSKNQFNLELISETSIPIQEDIAVFVEEFELYYKMIHFDLENLRYLNQVMNQASNLHSSKEELELHIVENNMHQKINKLLPLIRENVRVIDKSNNLQKFSEEKKYMRERNRLLKLKDKNENELRRLTRFEASLQRKIYLKKKKDDYRYKLLNKQLRKYRININNKVNKVKENEKSISSLDVQYREKIKEINEDYSKKIEIERQKILSIEKQRDFDIHRLRDRLILLEKETDKIVNNIMLRIDAQTQELNNFIDLSMPVKIDDIQLFYIQFYLIKYSKRNKVRYDFFTPKLVNINKSKFSAVKRRISGLDGKLSYLMKPFSRQLSSLIRRNITARLSIDDEFVLSLDKSARNHNLLINNGFLSELKQGLEQLSEKNILSLRESEKILRTFGKD